MAMLGAWLSYNAIMAVMVFVRNGGDLFSALFEPPISIIRIIGAGLLVISGLLVVFRITGGAICGLVGGAIIMLTGLLMSAAGADSQLWFDEVIYGAAALALCALMLTFQRARPV